MVHMIRLRFIYQAKWLLEAYYWKPNSTRPNGDLVLYRVRG